MEHYRPCLNINPSMGSGAETWWAVTENDKEKKTLETSLKKCTFGKGHCKDNSTGSILKVHIWKGTLQKYADSSTIRKLDKKLY